MDVKFSKFTNKIQTLAENYLWPNFVSLLREKCICWLVMLLC